MSPIDVGRRPTRGWKFSVAALAALTGFVIIMGQLFIWPYYIDQAVERGQSTSRLSAASMLGIIQQYKKLPALFSEDTEIKQLLQDPEDRQLVDRNNRELKYFNQLLESSDIYVLDANGITVAASNFDTDTSFVGDDFSFRPYFRTALEGGTGSYFALGATSIKRGYYFSSPVRVGNTIKGVVVFKVNIEVIEETWLGGEHQIVVTDNDGIIFMSSQKDWLFSSLRPLSPQRAAAIKMSRQYADIDITPLTLLQESGDGNTFLSIHHSGDAYQYADLVTEMPEVRWVLHVLLDTKTAYMQTAMAGVALWLAGALLVAGMAVWLHRRASTAAYLVAQQQAQRELEYRIEERTIDLKAAKTGLEKEVQERKNTERELRLAQANLVHSSKLAALGQVSATLSHELSQPLTAIRTYAENAGLLLELNRHEEARSNIKRIVAMADRMTKIGRHLRNFSTKAETKLYATDLATAVEDAIEVLESRLREADVTITFNPQYKVSVRADLVRLSQVFVNILSNAIDAVEGQAERRVTVSADCKGKLAVISIRDSGKGISAGSLKRIFDPFYTTKGMDSGMGLGLSISYNIIKDFGGELGVVNHPDGGAVVSIMLQTGAQATMPRQFAEGMS